MRDKVQQANARDAARPVPRARSPGIDIFRGILVILVILGHFAEITHQHSGAAWFGTGVRMPLFIGLSGYLFNLDAARALPLAQFLRKHYRRLILPWLLACGVHLTITGALDWTTPLHLILQPPYHLWFVPVLLSFMLIARGSGLDRSTLLALAIPFSILAMYALGLGHTRQLYHPLVPDRRYFIFCLYFMYGMWTANQTLSRYRYVTSIILAAIGLLWWSVLYLRASLPAEVAADVILSISLISLLPLLRHVRVDLPVIREIGQDSLYFYLWHPLIFALWVAAGVHGLPLFAVSMLTILALWSLIARGPSLAPLLGIRPAQETARKAQTALAGGAA